MKKDECFRLGVIIKPFSFKGEVVARFEVPDPLAYASIERVYLEVDESLIPYFIEKSSHKSKQQFRFALEDVSTEAEARALVGTALYLPLDEQDHEDEAGPELVGYRVVDAKLGELGEVVEYLDLPNNPQLEVSDGENEFLLPLQPAFIVEILAQDQLIKTDLPEGLVDL